MSQVAHTEYTMSFWGVFDVRYIYDRIVLFPLWISHVICNQWNTVSINPFIDCSTMFYC